jgi:trans-aconitate methyltransferase
MPYFFFSREQYRSWLMEAGFDVQRLELVPQDTFYAGEAAFAAWLRFTWLPFVQRVPERLREEFIQSVTQHFLKKHPLDAAGRVTVRMVRLEIVATKR